MNDARLGTFTAQHVAGYQPHAARAAVTGAAVVGQIDAIAHCGVQQQLAATREHGMSIYSDLVTFAIADPGRL